MYVYARSAAECCRNPISIRLPAEVGRGDQEIRQVNGKQKAALYLDVGLTEGLSLD